MKRMLRTLATLLSITLAACNTIPVAGEGPQASMDRFKAAFNKQDASGVAGIFLTDGRLLPAGKPMVVGREAIRDYWQGAFSAGVSHIEKSPVEVVVSGDLAVETNSYVVTFKGQPGAGKETLVWRRGSNRAWGISSDIWNNDK